MSRDGFQKLTTAVLEMSPHSCSVTTSRDSEEGSAAQVSDNVEYVFVDPPQSPLSGIADGRTRPSPHASTSWFEVVPLSGE